MASVHSAEYLAKLAMAYVARITPEQAEKIGAYAHEHDCGVWHASAQVRGQPEKCCCAKCHSIKGAFRAHTVAA